MDCSYHYSKTSFQTVSMYCSYAMPHHFPTNITPPPPHPPLPPQPDDDQDPSLDPDPALLQEIADAPTGMRDRDLRTMKDALLIETVQLLG